jgi:Pentapeptide repeats (8 copies)
MRRVLREVLRIAREVPAFASRHKVWAGIVIVLALLAVVIYLPRVPFVGPRSGREAESEFRGHLLQALGGLVLAVGAYFTGRTFALNREGQITERFTRAVEQLADEKLDIRLGGIYALERIARDSETHYEPVMEVLTAFLREHTREGVETSDPGSAKPDAGEPEQASQAPKLRSELRADFQAAATVIGKRDRRHERSDYHLNLRMVRLQGASLEDARLERAALSETDLSRSYLRHAVLSEADLDQADLSEADLSGANLSHAGSPEPTSPEPASPEPPPSPEPSSSRRPLPMPSSPGPTSPRPTSLGPTSPPTSPGPTSPEPTSPRPTSPRRISMRPSSPRPTSTGPTCPGPT